MLAPSKVRSLTVFAVLAMLGPSGPARGSARLQSFLGLRCGPRQPGSVGTEGTPGQTEGEPGKGAGVGYGLSRRPNHPRRRGGTCDGTSAALACASSRATSAVVRQASTAACSACSARRVASCMPDSATRSASRIPANSPSRVASCTRTCASSAAKVSAETEVTSPLVPVLSPVASLVLPLVTKPALSPVTPPHAATGGRMQLRHRYPHAGQAVVAGPA